MKRETFKDIEVPAGRRWRIEKMDAMTANFIATRLFSLISGLAPAIMAGQITDPAVIFMTVADAVRSIPRSEFFGLQQDAMSVVKELKMAGDNEVATPIRSIQGAWASDGLSDNPPLLLTLICHSLAFNLSPFFDGNALKEYGKSFKGLISFDAQT